MTIVYSDQVADPALGEGKRLQPYEDGGKIRIQPFKYTNATGGALAADTEIDLCDLPPGSIRILPNLCRYRMTAQGASRVLDIGHRKYTKSTINGVVEEAEDDDAFVSDKDVSSAVLDTAFDGGAAKMKFDIHSKAGVRVFATVNGDTIPAAAVLEGYIIFVRE